MRSTPNNPLDQFRETDPLWGSPNGANHGAFYMGDGLRVISSGERSRKHRVRWEHVSVSHGKRCPTWEEMREVKMMFWLPHETVVQFHPPEERNINMHEFCLHMWKPPYKVVLPPSILVGFKT